MMMMNDGEVIITLCKDYLLVDHLGTPCYENEKSTRVKGEVASREAK